MKYIILILLLILFITERLIKKQLTNKSETYKNKKLGFIKEKTGDNEIDKLIDYYNLVNIGGITLLITVIVINAIKWFSL